MFISVVAAAFTTMMSAAAADIAQPGQHAAASSGPARVLPAAAGDSPAGSSVAWDRKAVGLVTIERGRSAAIWHTEHARHLAHLRHLTYLRHRTAYQAATGPVPAASTAPAAAAPAAAVRAAAAAVVRPAAGARAEAAVTWALRQLSAPYLWGGTGHGGFDCSGLVMSAWRAAGVRLPRTSYQQAAAGTRITRAQLQPGDLIFTNAFGHVQMYIGHGQVVQAPAPGRTVDIAPLPAPGQVDAYLQVPAGGSGAHRDAGPATQSLTITHPLRMQAPARRQPAPPRPGATPPRPRGEAPPSAHPAMFCPVSPQHPRCACIRELPGLCCAEQDTRASCNPPGDRAPSPRPRSVRATRPTPARWRCPPLAACLPVGPVMPWPPARPSCPPPPRAAAATITFPALPMCPMTSPWHATTARHHPQSRHATHPGGHR